MGGEDRIHSQAFKATSKLQSCESRAFRRAGQGAVGKLTNPSHGDSSWHERCLQAFVVKIIKSSKARKHAGGPPAGARFKDEGAGCPLRWRPPPPGDSTALWSKQATRSDTQVPSSEPAAQGNRFIPIPITSRPANLRLHQACRCPGAFSRRWRRLWLQRWGRGTRGTRRLEFKSQAWGSPSGRWDKLC